MSRTIIENHREIAQYRMYLCDDCQEPYYYYCEQAGIIGDSRQLMNPGDCEMCAKRSCEFEDGNHNWLDMCRVCLEDYKNLAE